MSGSLRRRRERLGRQLLLAELAVALGAARRARGLALLRLRGLGRRRRRRGLVGRRDLGGQLLGVALLAALLVVLLAGAVLLLALATLQRRHEVIAGNAGTSNSACAAAVSTDLVVFVLGPDHHREALPHLTQYRLTRGSWRRGKQTV